MTGSHAGIAMAVGYCLVSSLASAAGDSRASGVLARCEHTVQRIHSFRFRVTGELFEPDPAGTRIWSSAGEVVYANGKYLAAAHGRNFKTGELLESESAYDGQRYQWLANKVLVLSSAPRIPTAFVCPSPIELPFLFLGSHSVVSFPDMRSPAVWRQERLVQQSRYLGVERLNVGECHKVQVPWLGGGDGEGSYWTVWFAAEKGYFPVQSVLRRPGGGALRIEVQAFRRVACDGGDLDFPAKVVQAASPAAGSRGAASYLVVAAEPESIEINVDFDDDLFTIPVTRANWLNDVDAKTFVRVGGDVASVTAPARNVYWAALLVPAIVICAIAAWWAGRRRRR